jgi:hypothetical protein
MQPLADLKLYSTEVEHDYEPVLGFVQERGDKPVIYLFLQCWKKSNWERKEIYVILINAPN